VAAGEPLNPTGHTPDLPFTPIRPGTLHLPGVALQGHRPGVGLQSSRTPTDAAGRPRPHDKGNTQML